jgi:hypothetical protein
MRGKGNREAKGVMRSKWNSREFSWVIMKAK